MKLDGLKSDRFYVDSEGNIDWVWFQKKEDATGEDAFAVLSFSKDTLFEVLKNMLLYVTSHSYTPCMMLLSAGKYNIVKESEKDYDVWLSDFIGKHSAADLICAEPVTRQDLLNLLCIAERRMCGVKD